MPVPAPMTGLAVAELLADPPADPPRIDGVVVAAVAGLDAGGAPRITFAGNPLRRPVSARPPSPRTPPSPCQRTPPIRR